MENQWKIFRSCCIVWRMEFGRWAEVMPSLWLSLEIRRYKSTRQHLNNGCSYGCRLSQLTETIEHILNLGHLKIYCVYEHVHMNVYI